MRRSVGECECERECMWVIGNWLVWRFCSWLCCFIYTNICMRLLMYINNCIDTQPLSLFSFPRHSLSLSIVLAYQFFNIWTTTRKDWHKNYTIHFWPNEYLHYRINPCNNRHFFAWCVHLCSIALAILLKANIVGILFGFPWIWSVVCWLSPASSIVYTQRIVVVVVGV